MKKHIRVRQHPLRQHKPLERSLLQLRKHRRPKHQHHKSICCNPAAMTTLCDKSNSLKQWELNEAMPTLCGDGNFVRPWQLSAAMAAFCGKIAESTLQHCRFLRNWPTSVAIPMFCSNSNFLQRWSAATASHLCYLCSLQSGVK